jgi:hypothetical protein
MSVSSKRALVSGAVILLGLGGLVSPAAAQDTGWRIASIAPSYTGGDGFSDIAVTGPADTWAVGTAPCCATDGRKITHWDGNTWQSVDLPAAPQGTLEPQLSTVGASSPENVWVFGNGADGPAFGHHWDGTTWQTTTFSADARIRETAVIAPEDAWVAGLERTDAGDRPIIEHYDGDQWTETSLPSTVQDVTAISADAADDVWATGDDDAGVPVTLHWDGSVWHSVALPEPSVGDGVRVAVGDVLAVGPHEAWASGFLTDMGLQPGPVLWHWNGKHWSLVPIDAPDDSLTSLASDGGHGVWMVSAGVRPTADLLHYSHGSLTREPAPVEPDTTADVDGIVLIPGTHSLWGAGRLVRNGHSAATVYRYDPES